MVHYDFTDDEREELSSLEKVELVAMGILFGAGFVGLILIGLLRTLGVW